ncbi:anti-RNA polymerase sigma 70 factor [Alcanivorax hongdengensis A-11-3]|uniref:Anti-RNA polymerase sigma 70 factor n=1 Tax=Alcanivorax hongdengensis A-11-3 TaxID=1177179 RepID=L0WF07_9GAMM|nr:anti-RNA polymerase sigma 70 factor [Alcanivorax hongdengensis A-11-3]
MVQAWLDERRQLIVLLCAIQGLRNYSEEKPQPVHQQVQAFCQLLMDYISAGYFEIYRELVNEARSFRRDNPELTRHILARLDSSTDEALAFNAEFEKPERCQQKIHELPDRISHLMETLEERFSLEDQLILSIHQQEPPRLQAVMH